jgi:hypothetical protein
MTTQTFPFQHKETVRFMNCPCCGNYHDSNTRMGRFMAEHYRMLLASRRDWRRSALRLKEYVGGRGINEKLYAILMNEIHGERGTPTMDASDPPTEE